MKRVGVRFAFGLRVSNEHGEMGGLSLCDQVLDCGFGVFFLFRSLGTGIVALWTWGFT